MERLGSEMARLVKSLVNKHDDGHSEPSSHGKN